jgi:hypothetical protein
MSDSEVRFVGDLSRVEVRPNDVFVLHCDQTLTIEMQIRIRAQLSEALGGANVLVLGDGMKLGVVGPVEGS